jgi:hypothetical protein
MPKTESHALTLTLSHSVGEGTPDQRFMLVSPLYRAAGEGGGEGARDGRALDGDFFVR